MRNLTGNFNALIQDLSCGTRVDTNDRTADRCLSGTGLAYEGEGLSLVDVKRSIFYCFVDTFKLSYKLYAFNSFS